jgi:hypothetical protein
MPFTPTHFSSPPRAHLANPWSLSLSAEGERHRRSPRRRGRLPSPAGLLLLSSLHLHDPLASLDLMHPFFVFRSSSSCRHCRSLRGRTPMTSDRPPTSHRQPMVSLASPQTLACSPAMSCVHARARKRDAAPSDLDQTVTYHFDRPGPGQAARSGPAQV